MAGALLGLLCACASQPAGLRPFTSDGCSLFPDRSRSADWCGCCVEHDLAYWRGGTQAQRLAADQRLEQCIVEKTASPVLAQTMLAGVRIGGSPYLHTPFRWAYGWPFERNYEPLTREENRRADALESGFRAAQAAAPCR